MGGPIAQSIVLLGGLVVQIVTLCYLIKYVRATVGIQKAAVAQTQASQDLAQWQRKQWALDNRKQEWRELIGTLTQCIQKISLAEAVRTTPSGQDLRGEAQRAGLDAERVIEDRLFITEFVEREHVLEAWQEVAKKAFSAGVTLLQERVQQQIGALIVANKAFSAGDMLQQESQQKWAALHRKLVRAAQADLGVAVGGLDTAHG